MEDSNTQPTTSQEIVTVEVEGTIVEIVVNTNPEEL